MESNPMSLLIIEDDIPFLELIRINLKPRKVRFAHTFKDALKLMQELPAEVVILDLSLPDSTPAETIKRIAEIKRISKDVTVIVITGSPEIYRLHNQALCNGADFILSKDNGFFDALAAALIAVGRRWRCASEPTIEKIEHEVRRMVQSPT
jgi:ActR/RegA family two-component response regulator